MPSQVKIFRRSLANMLILMKFTEALRSNCSLDAAVTYTWNNVMYLFKGNKYVRWGNDDYLGVVTGTPDFLNVFIFFYYLLTQLRYSHLLFSGELMFGVFLSLSLCVYLFRGGGSDVSINWECP